MEDHAVPVDILAAHDADLVEVERGEKELVNLLILYVVAEQLLEHCPANLEEQVYFVVSLVFTGEEFENDHVADFALTEVFLDDLVLHIIHIIIGERLILNN